MNRNNGDALCDLVRNFTGSLEGIINKRDRGKLTRWEMAEKISKRTEKFSDALWLLMGKKRNEREEEERSG